MGAPSVKTQPKVEIAASRAGHQNHEGDLFEYFDISPDIAEKYLENGFAEDNAARIAYLDDKWHLRDPREGGWGDGGYVTSQLDLILDALVVTDDDLDALGSYLRLRQMNGWKLLDATSSLVDMTKNPRGVSMFDISEVELQRTGDVTTSNRAFESDALINLLASSPFEGIKRTNHAASWLDSTNGYVLETTKLRYAVPRASPDVARSAPAKATGSMAFDEVIVRSEIAYLATGGDDDSCREAIAKIASMELDFQPLTKKKTFKTRDDFAGMDDELVSLAAEAYKSGRLEGFMTLAAANAPRPQLEAYVAEDMSAVLSEGAL